MSALRLGPVPFRHYPDILAGNSIGMAMTNGYVCGQVVAALWRSPAALGQGLCTSASHLARLAAVALRRALQVAGPGFLSGQSAPFERCEEWCSGGVDVRLRDFGGRRGLFARRRGRLNARAARKKPYVCVLI